MTSVEIKETLDLSWNEINSDLGMLQKKDYIHIEQTFVENSMRLVITPELKGIFQFQRRTELLEIFIKQTSNMQKYLDYVIEITEKGEW